MSAARESIIRDVRAALVGRAEAQPTRRSYRRAGALDTGSTTELFAQRVADYRANVHRSDALDLPGVIGDIVGCGRFGVPFGLPDRWRPVGAVVDDKLSAAGLDRLDGVVTGCTVAIAEIGTIVLAGGPRDGRRALTLIPDVHVCVVETDQIVETVPEAFQRLEQFATRPLTFVSGPSATSDIELRRVEGVHGPRRLIVVIVDREDQRD